MQGAPQQRTLVIVATTSVEKAQGLAKTMEPGLDRNQLVQILMSVLVVDTTAIVMPRVEIWMGASSVYAIVDTVEMESIVKTMMNALELMTAMLTQCVLIFLAHTPARAWVATLEMDVNVMLYSVKSVVKYTQSVVLLVHSSVAKNQCRSALYRVYLDASAHRELHSMNA